MNNLLNLGLVALALNVQLFSNGIAPKSNSIDNLNKLKALDINFDTHDITNTVTSKKYPSKNKTSNFIAGIKGKGFEFNGDYFQIPTSDLKLSGEEEYLTVTLKYKFGGSDKIQMLAAFGYYNLYHYDGKLGFNTGNGDLYGLSTNLSTSNYTDIVAVFHKNDVTKNKLYLNGVKQDLTHMHASGPYDNISQEFSKDFRIGYWGGDQEDKYLIHDTSVIDEVKLYRGSVTDKQVSEIVIQHNIPELRLSQNKNHAKLDWATQILDSDILCKIGFEDGGISTNFDWAANKLGDITGGQRISTDERYDGIKSVYIPRTRDGMGNHYNFPHTTSETSIMQWPRIKIPNGTKLSVSFNAKNINTGTNIVKFGGDGGEAYSTYKSPAKYTSNFDKGSTLVTVDMQNEFSIGSWITTDTKDIFTHGRIQVANITNNPDGTATLQLRDPINFDVKKGDHVTLRPFRPAWSFGDKEITSTDWQLQNSNTTVSDNADFDIGERGGSFLATTDNQTGLYLDDIRLGYATRVKVFRDGNVIYEGYDSELEDITATDKSKPSNVSNVKHTLTINKDKTRILDIAFNPSTDKGTSYNYQIQGLSKIGTTPISATKTITLSSELQGYSYVIDKNSTTIPDNTIDTTSTQITHKLNPTDSGEYFLHIKALDGDGNTSETIHHKMQVADVSKINLDTRHHNSLFKSAESIPLTWSVIGEKNFKKLFVDIKNVDTSEAYTYNLSPDSDAFAISSLPKGVYNITLKAIDILERPITSNQIQIRVSTFLNNGFVTSKVIETLNPITCLRVSLKQSIPKDTLVLTKVYIQNSNGNFDLNNPILIDTSQLDKEIKLPYPTKKIFFEFTLSGTQENSPDIDEISISAR